MQDFFDKKNVSIWFVSILLFTNWGRRGYSSFVHLTIDIVTSYWCFKKARNNLSLQSGAVCKLFCSSFHIRACEPLVMTAPCFRQSYLYPGNNLLYSNVSSQLRVKTSDPEIVWFHFFSWLNFAKDINETDLIKHLLSKSKNGLWEMPHFFLFRRNYDSELFTSFQTELGFDKSKIILLWD